VSETLLINIFIIIALILMVGYFFGRRKNQTIAASAINALQNALKPDDQKITNIGGVIGYHVEMSFSSDRNIKTLKGTMTMLPRQSLLYLPMSMLFRGFDRFFITITLKEPPSEKRAHIFEKRFFSKHRRDVGNDMQQKEFRSGSRDFIYLYEYDSDLVFLEALVDKIEDPARLKEISIHPESGVIELLVVPTAGENMVLTSIISCALDYKFV
jgi:preprotein translocase subunit YajC